MNISCSSAFRWFAVAVWLPIGGWADDWPQWRGPNRDGVWRETGILDSIPASGLPVRWRVRVGAGYAGPSVAQGRVFVVDHQFDPEVERVLCFDEATGRQLWMHSYPTDYADMEYGNGPRAAPTVHDGKVYTLVCLDATCRADGSTRLCGVTAAAFPPSPSLRTSAPWPAPEWMTPSVYGL